MNITYLNQPFNFVAPAPDIIRACRTELERKLATRDNVYLPSIKHRLENLSELLIRLEDHVRQVLTASPVSLQTEELAVMVESMRQASSLQPATLAASVKQKYQAEVSDIIAASLSTLGEQAGILNGLLDGLSAWALPDSTAFVVDQQRQSEAIRQALDAVTAECADLEARKQQINDAIRIYDDKTVFDRWTPILEDAARIRPSNPTLAVLQAAVIGVTNIFNIASEMVKYGDLVEARSHLQTNLEGKYVQIAEHRKQIRTLALRNEQLEEIQGIDKPKQLYEQEVRKVADALDTFASGLQPHADIPVADYAHAFSTQADALAAWLRMVLKKWK